MVDKARTQPTDCLAGFTEARTRFAELFHALSDPTRLAILESLRNGERCVCDLMGLLDAQQSRLSFHLKTLKDAGIVSDRRDGRWIHYSINPEVLTEMQNALNALSAAVQKSAAGCCTRR